MFKFFHKIETCKLQVYKSNRTISKTTYNIFTSRNKSHYTSLELSDSASLDDIKSAYYKLSFKYHPDKNDGSVESTEKFREITEAYEILSNPEKKESYDRNLKASQNNYDFQKSNQSYWRSNVKGRYSPRTGRTNYYNYDEHFKMHYEQYMKQRQMENDFFKRKWEENRKTAPGGYYRSNKSSPYNYPYNASERARAYSKMIYLLGIFVWIYFVLNFAAREADKASRIYNPDDKERKNT